MIRLRETMRALLSLAFWVLLAASAFAQSFPSRPLRMIVPAPPAGITDLSARLVGEGLRAKFGQPVVVDMPGLDRTIATRLGLAGLTGFRFLWLIGNSPPYSGS